ncbi:MAG: hypothetical protein YYHSYBAR_001684 [Candidatus Fervidibacter sacchari]
MGIRLLSTLEENAGTHTRRSDEGNFEPYPKVSHALSSGRALPLNCVLRIVCCGKRSRKKEKGGKKHESYDRSTYNPES